MPSPSVGQILSANSFAADFDQRPFALQHGLADSELFELARLRRLARQLRESRGPQAITCLIGSKNIGAVWDDWSDPSSAAEACIDNIERPGSWVLLKEIQSVAEYGDLLDRVFAEIRSMLPVATARELTWPSAYVFVSSPGFVTPFHIDHELGLLLQVRGTKEMHLFSHADREVLPETELEAYYMGDLAAAKYRPELESRGTVFELGPGDGVCFPAHDPHWVATKSTYSVSLSINVCLRRHDRDAYVYQVNHYLRRLGLAPRPPGSSPVADAFKRVLIKSLSKRHPENKQEMLRSGIHRLARVSRAVRRLLPSSRTALR
jgi:hypothetical protein